MKTSKHTKKTIAYWLIFSAIILLIILIMQPLELYLFYAKIPVLFPKGIIGVEQRDLLLILQVLMLIFVIPVYILTFLFCWWYRADNTKSVYDPNLVDNKIAEIIWWGVPLIFTIGACTLTWVKTYELDPYRPIESDKKPLTVEVVALQWKWLFLYPEEKIATVNTLHIPIDRPIHFRITADAPMNAFWIPRLGGMIYAMPGMDTQLYLIANEEGTFRGSSAQVSGKGFSGMIFDTVATSEASYEQWVEQAKKASKSLDFSSYQELAKPSENDPAQLFQLQDGSLFHKILMKYMMPAKSA